MVVGIVDVVSVLGGFVVVAAGKWLADAWHRDGVQLPLLEPTPHTLGGGTLDEDAGVEEDEESPPALHTVGRAVFGTDDEPVPNPHTIGEEPFDAVDEPKPHTVGVTMVLV